MAFRLSDFVVRGELLNTKNYSTHGWLELRGAERPLMIELTGNCGDDLRGLRFRFEAVDSPWDDMRDKELPQNLAWHQIGPTGTMSAADWVRVFNCSVKDFVTRAELGEPPPTKWKRHLYLEWYSQNGRVLVELADPILEYLDGQHWKKLPLAKPAPLPDEEILPSLPGITVVDANGTMSQIDSLEDYQEENREKDSFRTIPDDLQRQLDARTRSIDQLIQGKDETEEAISEMELMDHLMEYEEGDRIGTFLDTQRLPHPDSLSDQQAETQLKTLLAQLALWGVALHVCEHFSPRDAYRLLIERICREEHAFKQLRNTGCVQNFMTAEYCDACNEEADRAIEEPDQEPGPSH